MSRLVVSEGTLQPASNGSSRPSLAQRLSSMNGHLAQFDDGAQGDYSEGIQIINEDKEFTPSLPLYMRAQDLDHAGFNYHLVAVFGSQSTGKSTLLNHLFSTSFEIMDEANRKQTTKGIWMSRSRNLPPPPVPQPSTTPAAISPLAANANGNRTSELLPEMADNILVMDVEGTDGRERGEDQDFERKAALFALATSEVMIVNIWEHQVGLYQGANMGLLKTVFEVNLQLFQARRGEKDAKQRSLLFFVIRDHIGHTPLSNLATTLEADLKRIWHGLSKPPGLERCELKDYFDMEFVALPHKLLQPQAFVDSCVALRARFVETYPASKPRSPSISSKIPPTISAAGTHGVFHPSYHRRIPADGFPLYASGIWEQILANKDLDLPTQQALLAQYRCDEISASALELFDSYIIPFESKSKAGKVLEGLGPVMNRARAEALKAFEAEAKRYFKPVYEKKGEELGTKIDSRLKVLFIGQLGALAKHSISSFQREVLAVLKAGAATSTGKAPTGAQKSATSGGAAGYDFANVVKAARSRVLQEFKDEAAACVVSSSGWTFSEEYMLLEADIDEVAARLRQEELKRLVARLERSVKAHLSTPLSKEFTKVRQGEYKVPVSDSDVDGEKSVSAPALTLWDAIWDEFLAITSEATSVLASKSALLSASPEEVILHTYRLRYSSLSSALLARLKDEVGNEANVLLKLREAFEEQFRYDHSAAGKGVPRVWRKGDDIEGAYKSARDSVEALIPLLSRFVLSSTNSPPDIQKYLGNVPDDGVDDLAALHADSFEEDDDGDGGWSVLLSPSKQADVRARFRRAADGMFVEAKRSTIASIASIPAYMYGLLLVLGWNEIMAVLRNPLYFVMLLLLLAGAYVAHTLNLWGPIVQVSNAMVTQGTTIAKDRLRELLEVTQHVADEPHGSGSPRTPRRRQPVAFAGRSERAGEEYEMHDLPPSANKTATKSSRRRVSEKVQGGVGGWANDSDDE